MTWITPVGWVEAESLHLAPIDGISTATLHQTDTTNPGTQLTQYLPARGLLTIEVSTPAPAGALPRLVVAPQPGLRTVAQTPTTLTVAVEGPGDYRFEVLPQDPQKPLGTVRLDTLWLGQDTVLAANTAYSTTEDEDDPWTEIEPDTATLLDAPGHLGVNRSEASEDEEPWTEIEPDTWILDPTDACVRQVRGHGWDRHGDTFACATPLLITAGVPTADLSTAMDRDVFVVTLERQRTLVFESTGGTDTFASLFDHRGLRLAMDDDGGEGKNFRLVATLPAGRYALRVEGTHGAVGEYGLISGVLDRR